MQRSGIMDVAATAEDEALAALRMLPAARLGSLLNTRRKEAKLRKRTAAEVAGIEVSVLDEIESGQRLPDSHVLAALLARYGVGPTEFFPRRKPVEVTQSSHATNVEVLRDFVDQVRGWRQVRGKEKLNFRQQDVVVLSRLLGSDPDEIERRLIALTGCSPERQDASASRCSQR